MNVELATVSSDAAVRRSRRALIAASALATLATAAVATASADAHDRGHTSAARIEVVRFTPSSPLSSERFTARWRSVQARRKGRTYRAELRITAPDGSLCTLERTLAIRRGWNTGDTLTFRLRPNDRTLGSESLWCPGKATFRVFSIKPGTPSVTHVTKRLRIRADPDNPVPKGTPIEADVLEGSQLTVQAPGRPDRVSTLSGRLTGHLLGAGDGGSDAAFELTAGELAIDALAIDPLCTANGRTGANRVELAPTGTKGRLVRGGEFTMTLRIDEDPIGLTGCQGAGGTLQSRAVALSGRGPADGDLTRVEASGAIDAVAYSDGTRARVAFTLALGFDLTPD